MQHYDEPPGVYTTNSSLYDRYAKPLCAYIRLHLASWEDAEDVLCEVFLAAFQQKQFVAWNEEQQLAWLRRVAHNKVADHYRRTAHIATLPLEQAFEEALHDDTLTPEQVAVRHEEFQQLYRVIETLSLVQQQILRLRFGDDLRFAEIALLLKMREDAVRKISSRTLARLRSIYEQESRNRKD